MALHYDFNLFVMADNTVCLKKYALKKSLQLNISKYYQEIFIPVGSYGSFLSNDTKIFDNISMLEY